MFWHYFSLVLQTLLDLSASPNYKDNHSLTPLYHCVLHSSNSDCVEMLLHDHAIVGTNDDRGWTEVHQVTIKLIIKYESTSDQCPVSSIPAATRVDACSVIDCVEWMQHKMLILITCISGYLNEICFYALLWDHWLQMTCSLSFLNTVLLHILIAIKPGTLQIDLSLKHNLIARTRQEWYNTSWLASTTCIKIAPAY